MTKSKETVPSVARIKPLAQLGGRLPLAGKLRLGVKAGRGMKSIDTFRFTSPHEDLIVAAAELYGAKEGPRPWRDPAASPKDQHEVITEASSIRVFLPPNALSVHYELWSGGGVQRRCDGEACEQVQVTNQGAELTRVSCICVTEQRLSCKPTSRLNVVIPELRLAGTWMLESKGWNAMEELAGMEATIAEMQSKVGVIEALLSVQQVERSIGGKKRKYVVPKLALTTSPLDLISGAANIRTLTPTSPTRPSELPAATPAEIAAAPDTEATPDWFNDDTIVDAEIVDDPTPTLTVVPGPQPVDKPGDEMDPLHIEVVHMIENLKAGEYTPAKFTVDQIFVRLALWASRDAADTWAALTQKQRLAVYNAAKDLLSGYITADWQQTPVAFTRTQRP